MFSLHNIYACCSVPDQPRKVEDNCDVAIKTSQICINWLKPDGGDAIDEYYVEWLRADGSISSTKLDHIHEQPVYNYTISGLLPEEKITSYVIAANDAGNGTSLRESHITSTLYNHYFLFCLQQH